MATIGQRGPGAMHVGGVMLPIVETIQVLSSGTTACGRPVGETWRQQYWRHGRCRIALHLHAAAAIPKALSRSGLPLICWARSSKSMALFTSIQNTLQGFVLHNWSTFQSTVPLEMQPSGIAPGMAL